MRSAQGDFARSSDPIFGRFVLPQDQLGFSRMIHGLLGMSCVRILACSFMRLLTLAVGLLSNNSHRTEQQL